MLEIRRPALRNDVDLLRTLIHEMGEYERLRPCQLPRRRLRAMDLGHDKQPAGYAFFFNCYSTFHGRVYSWRIFLCAQNFWERKLAMRCLRMLQPPLATRRVLGSC
jgi:hypothetical protein